jgi:hypothetical protein
MHSRFSLPLARDPARSRQRADLRPLQRRTAVRMPPEMAAARVTRGYPRAGSAQPARRPPDLILEAEANLSTTSTRARPQRPVGFGPSEWCDRGAERVGGVRAKCGHLCRFEVSTRSSGAYDHRAKLVEDFFHVGRHLWNAGDERRERQSDFSSRLAPRTHRCTPSAAQLFVVSAPAAIAAARAQTLTPLRP